jgi:iron complex transport system substrate-binding protein
MSALRLRWRVLSGALAGLMAGASSAGVYVDDAGRRIELAKPAQRVVTLAPNLTEFVYAVGAGTQLVGRDEASTWPPEANRVERVGDFQRVDIERVLTLKPDLVLAWHHGNPSRELQQLDAAGLKVFRLEPQRLEDIARALERTGELLGHEAQARAAAQAMRSDIESLRRQYARATPVRVFYEVWQQPLMTLNGRHLVNDMLAACGGVNVFAELGALAPVVSLESVAARDPQAFFTGGASPDERAALRRDPDAPAFAAFRPLRGVSAVRTGSLYLLNSDEVVRQGPRVVDGARAICRALQEVRSAPPSR